MRFTGCGCFPWNDRSLISRAVEGDTIAPGLPAKASWIAKANSVDRKESSTGLLRPSRRRCADLPRTCDRRGATANAL